MGFGLIYYILVCPDTWFVQSIVLKTVLNQTKNPIHIGLCRVRFRTTQIPSAATGTVLEALASSSAHTRSFKRSFYLCQKLRSKLSLVPEALFEAFSASKLLAQASIRLKLSARAVTLETERFCPILVRYYRYIPV